MADSDLHYKHYLFNFYFLLFLYIYGFDILSRIRFVCIHSCNPVNCRTVITVLQLTGLHEFIHKSWLNGNAGSSQMNP